MDWDAKRGVDWVGLPAIATVARLLCHPGRIRGGTPFTDSRLWGRQVRTRTGPRKKELTTAGCIPRRYRYLPHKRGPELHPKRGAAFCL
jgi:hypothetical protein